MSAPRGGRWFERPRAVALATWLGLFIALLGFDPWKFVDITTAPVTGCEARLVQFRRMGEHEDLVPPNTVLGWQNPEARDGTITMQRPATWHFLQVEQARRESAVGPSVRQRFFISTIGSNGLTARLEQYPLGPGTYVARVQVRPGNTAIETTNLVFRVDYTGEIGLSATLMSEDALS